MNVLLVLASLGGLASFVSPYLRRESTVVRFLIIGCSFAMTTRYFAWRVWKLPRLELATYPLLCYGFLALEGIATYLAMEDFRLLRRTKNRSVEANRCLDWYGDKPPRVDILIATYNESWEVLEKTIVGATNQNYANYHTWILDDGHRTWLREKAESHNVGYVTRTENAHYKAGNLNNGIAEIRKQGIDLEFIALLDADFIARPEFLRRTMALMADAAIGIVQTPQCFYNADPHQQAFCGVSSWPDEQRGWFDVYLPSLDALGWATCCGTSCLIRLKALDAINGFPTVSVCEDTLSSMMMSQKGWRTAFLHERLTVGLAPEGIGEFLTQRARWLLGGVQNTRHQGPGPGIGGRIRYWLGLWRLAIWGIMPLLWVTLTIMYWFTGTTLIPVLDFDEAVSYFGPLWLGRIFQGWLFRGRVQPFVSDAIWMLLAPLWVKDTFRAVLGSKARFKVTDKAQHRDRHVVHWRLLPMHASMVILLLSGLLYTVFDPTAPVHHDGFMQSNTALTIWFIFVILAGIAPMVESPKRRSGDRYRTSESVTAIVGNEQERWPCVDISIGGVLVRTNGAKNIPTEIDLQLDGLDAASAELVRTSQGYAAFAFRDAKLRPDLIRRLYCTDDYIVAPERWGFRKSTGAFFKRLLF